MLRALSYENEVPTELRFKLLRTLSKIKNPDIEEQIALCIIEFGQTDIPTSMDILRELAIRNDYTIYGFRSLAFQELGKNARDQCLQIFKAWANEKLDKKEKYKLQYILLPDILMELTLEDRNSMISVIEELSNSEQNDVFVISTIKEYMKIVPKERWLSIDSEDKKRLDSCISILKKIAIRLGKPSEKFPRVKEKIFQCGQLIELIQHKELVPQPDLVKEGLELFPNIRRFVSVTVDEEELKKPTPKPLFLLLGSDRCSYKKYLKKLDDARNEKRQNLRKARVYQARDSLFRFGTLTHLDNCLTQIRETEFGTQELRAKLLHEEIQQFRSAVSEIEVIGRLRPHLPLTISEEAPTKVGTSKRLDLGITILESQIHIEVITPDMAAILRYLGGGGIPNRLVGKIISEYDKHLKGLTDDKDALIIADISHSEMDYLSAESAMYGSLAFSMMSDTEKRKIITAYPTREKKAISVIEPATRKILGVIVYKKTLTKEGGVSLRGRFVQNPFSENEKGLLACRVIEETFLDIVDKILY